MSRESARLLDKIRRAGVPVPDNATFRQTHAGRNQRANGGAVWVLSDSTGRLVACSAWSRRVLLSGEITVWRDAMNEWHVDPA